jgi:hypothetical protein
MREKQKRPKYYKVKTSELEVIYFLQQRALKEVLKKSFITRLDFKYLLIGRAVMGKRGYYLIKDFGVALRACCDHRAGHKRLLLHGYVEQVAGRKFWSKVGCKYRVTGKGVYLINKYTEVLRRLIEESEELGTDIPKDEIKQKSFIIDTRNKGAV